MRRLLRLVVSSAAARRWEIYALVALLLVGSGVAAGVVGGVGTTNVASGRSAALGVRAATPAGAPAVAPAPTPSSTPSPTPRQAPTVAIPAKEDVPDSFAGTQDVIIQSKPGATDELVHSLTALGIDVTEKFTSVINGAAVSVTQEQLAAIRSTVDSASISKDLPAVLFANNTQSNAPWNLDRIDQQAYTASGTAGSYIYPASAGSGVTVFIVDSGFTRQNTELDGRVGAGMDFAGGDHGTPLDTSDDTSVIDCNGHGTHVSGTVASTTYGVAKLATIVPVRVFGCKGSTSTSKIIAGIEWAINNRPLNAPSVINMSLGTVGGSVLIDQATQSAIDSGMTVVVAAGNGGADSIGDDACFGSINSTGVFEDGTSPARVVDAITVGATGYANPGQSQPLGRLQDFEASFSNYGTCVDLLAPGGSVTSLDYASAGTQIMSGTSMASPLVAGVAALYLSANPLASPADVQRALVANAASGKITAATTLWPPYISGYPTTRTTPSPNLLVNTQFLSATAGMPGVPTNLTSSAATSSSVALAWTAPQDLGGGTISDYVIQYRDATTSQWSTFAHTPSASTSITVTGLSTLAQYEFQVAAMTYQATGAFSDTASNLSAVTSVPRNLAAATATPYTVPLTWAVPSSLNGGTITDYVIQFKTLVALNWSTFAHPASTATGVTVTGLSASTVYQFQVAAHTVSGDSAFATAVTATTLVAPLTTTEPRGLAVGSATATTAPLTWSAPLTLNGLTITDYVVQFKLSGASSWSTFADGVSVTTGATVTGLSANTSYQFQVAARTALTDSAYSAAVSMTTLSGLTSAPVSLVAGTATVSSVPLTWSAPSTLNGGTISDYVVQYKTTPAASWSTFTDAVSATTGATVTGLSNNSSYQFHVAAYTAQGLGVFTAVVTTNTLSGVTTAPLTVAAGTAAASSVPLTWAAPATLNGGTITDYRVQYKASTATSWSTFTRPASATTGATVTGLAAKTSYQFQVAAYTAQGFSAYTAAVSATTSTGITTVPRSLAALTATTNTVALTWTVPLTLNGGSITDYRVQYRLNGSLTWLTFSDAVTATTGATVTGLTAGKSYQFHVAAYTAQGFSAYSAIVTKATPAS